MTNKIVTITGPSCSGKSTLTKMLLLTGAYTEVVSTTTRPIRSGEVNGSTYHYVTREEFDTMEMLERIEYNGNIYGGSVVEFEEKFASGKTPVIIVEPNGMQQINKNAIEKDWTVLNVFVGCPLQLQAERFLGRFIVDYRSLLASGSDSDYQKFMKEYTGRMVAMRETEANWEETFIFTEGNKLHLPHFTRESQNIDIELIAETIGDL